MAGPASSTEAGAMENILNPVDLELNRSGRISARQRKHLWRQVIGPAAVVLVAAPMAIGGVLAFNIAAAVPALMVVLSIYDCARRTLDACLGEVSSADGTLDKRIERDSEDGPSYWLLLGGRKYSVQGDEFWKLCEGGPYRLWFSRWTRTVLNVAPLAGWQPSPQPGHATRFGVMSISPSEEPRPPVAYDLRPAPDGGWIFGVGLRQWWFRSGEVMTRPVLTRNGGWTRLAHPRLRVDEARVGDEAQTTLRVFSDGGTRQIGSASLETVAGASTPLLQLGRFMAAHTGLPLEARETIAPADPRRHRWNFEIELG